MEPNKYPVHFAVDQYFQEFSGFIIFRILTMDESLTWYLTMLLSTKGLGDALMKISGDATQGTDGFIYIRLRDTIC